MTSSNETKPARQTEYKLAWVILALVLFCDLWLIASSAVDLPYADDYGTLLDFVADVKEHGFSWSQLWAQQSEHRPVFGRSVTLAAYLLTGRVNFSLLALLGNVAWAHCVFILARHAYRRSGSNAWIMLATVMLLLVPVHHENALWGISGLAFYGLSAFCLFSFAMMAEQRTVAGLGAAVGAVLTSAGGFLVFPVICGDLFLRHHWKRLAIVVLTALVLAGIFFSGHHGVGPPGAHLPKRSVGAMVLYVLCFLGGAFPSKALALLAGSLLAPALLWLVWRVRQDRFVGMVAAFLLLTAAAAAWSRSRMGVEQALDSRYSVFSLIALCCVLITATNVSFVRQNLRSWMIPGAGIVLAAGLTLAVFQGNRWNLQRVRILTDFYLAINRTRWNGHLALFLDRAKRVGVYDAWVAAAAVGRLQPTPYVKPKSTEVPLRGYVDIYEEAYLLGWAHLPGRVAAHAQISIVAESSSGCWRLPVWRADRPDLDPVFKDGGSYLQSGFQIALTDYALPAGRYRLYVLVEDEEYHGRMEIEPPYEVPLPPVIVVPSS